MSKAKKPPCRLTRTDGNVFAIIGAVSKTLKAAGLEREAAEFMERCFAAKSYEEILGGIVQEYVEVY